MSAVHPPNELQRSQPKDETYPHTPTQERYLRRTLIAIGVTALAVVLLWLLWQGLNVILLVFGGILFGVLLRALTDGLKRIVSMPDKIALGIVILVLLALIVGALWFMGPRISSQVSQINQNINSVSGQLRQTLSQVPWGQQILGWLPPIPQVINQTQTGLTGGGIFSNITGIVSRAAEVATAVILIFFSGIFFAADPGLYMRGVARLFPHDKRKRVWAVLRAEEHTLRWWLIGTAISMATAGVLSGLALWLLGVPLAFTLGLIMGVAEFVPYIGPLLGMIPAVLMAFTVSPQTALWVIVVLYAVQVLEGNVILPLVLQKSVDLPPVITITAQVLLGVLAGAVGILFATPLAAALLVLVKLVYVENVLGDDMDVEMTVN